MYEYFWFSIILLIIWGILFFLKKIYRKEMLFVSFFSFAAGFLEPFFVPEYWNPEVIVSIFGLDIESFIFSFSAGGIGSVLYVFLSNKRYVAVNKDSLFFINRLIIIIPFFLIAFIHLLTEIKFMYNIFIVMTIQLFVVFLLRNDLLYDMAFGGIYFMLFYSIGCFILSYLDLSFFNSWNHIELLGISIFGVPIEELIWAFYFGTFTSVVYKYTFSLKLKHKKKNY